MAYLQTATTNRDAPRNTAPLSESSESVDSLLRVRILIETAMQQSQFSDANAQLVVRQLAAELNEIGAALSDVRMAVQELYQGEQSAAAGYLAYLAENGFPLKKEPLVTESSAASAEEIAARTLEQQNVAIAPVSRQNAQADDAGSDFDSSLKRDQGNALNRIAFYPGNLITELVANSAYSAIVFGERRSGTSAILRAIAYDQIEKSAGTLLDILDLHSGEWGQLENIRFDGGSSMVTYLSLSTYDDIDALRQRLAIVAAEVRRRQQLQRPAPLSLSTPEMPPPYLFLIDGLSEVNGALPGWSADRRSKDTTLSLLASHLRFVLCHGPTVGVSCVATARDHSSCPCDATALGETKLLFLGRVSGGRNGGYRAIDRAIEDKALLPSPAERTRYREAMAAIKTLAYPVVFTPNGIPRLGRLQDFSSYLSADLLAHYQMSLEGGGL